MTKPSGQLSYHLLWTFPLGRWSNSPSGGSTQSTQVPHGDKVEPSGDPTTLPPSTHTHGATAVSLLGRTNPSLKVTKVKPSGDHSLPLATPTGLFLTGPSEGARYAAKERCNDTGWR